MTSDRLASLRMLESVKLARGDQANSEGLLGMQPTIVNASCIVAAWLAEHNHVKQIWRSLHAPGLGCLLKEAALLKASSESCYSHADCCNSARNPSSS